jgi:predicted aminopeptidase
MHTSVNANLRRIQQSAHCLLGRPNVFRASIVLLIILALSGCATLDYYGQAISGQFELWQRKQPISKMLAAANLAPDLRKKLELVSAARQFAHDKLALPAKNSYRDYVDLERDYVVWNVFAAPQLSLDPLTSCYPIVGCLEYRGFFAEADALRHAAQLRAKNHDVFVGGVAAYSTLGWFDDPVLNTILHWDSERIVEIIFHELAHQRVYLRGDSTFNESYAMAVGQAGVNLWLADRGRSNSHYVHKENYEKAFIALILDFRQQLATIYDSQLTDVEKLEQKHRLFNSLGTEYAALKSRWKGDERYDDWMARDLNNAKLASISTYHDHVDAFLFL